MTEWVFRALGVFWFVGGVMAIKGFAEARAYDVVLAAISGRGLNGRERLRAVVLAVGGVATVASGAMLVALDRSAPVLMVANAILQGAWVVAAPILFPPEDEDDLLARRRVRNAFLLWSAATVGVIVAVVDGAVQLETNIWVEAVVAVAAVVALAVQAPALFQTAEQSDDTEEAGVWDAEDAPAADPSDPIDPTIPRRWMIAPNIYTPPLRDVDTDETFHPVALPLDEDLAERIDDLDCDVREALTPSREDPEVWVLTPEARAAFELRIVALTEALKPIARDGDVTWWLPPVEEPHG